MKTFAILFLLSTLFAGINFCYGQNDSIDKNNTVIQIGDTIPGPLLPSNWLNTFDLDGDGKCDPIYFEYTGGAHCCYKISIKLSSDSIIRQYPFEMDGGYLWGVDNSYPDKFTIRDIDKDSLPEILMKIETYNADVYPIPRKWKRLYGIKTNNIVIEYQNGNLTTRDQ